jgi:hypothetical protein
MDLHSLQSPARYQRCRRRREGTSGGGHYRVELREQAALGVGSGSGRERGRKVTRNALLRDFAGCARGK